MTDAELLDLLSQELAAERIDYIHIYREAGGIVVEIDGLYLTRDTLREALATHTNPLHPVRSVK